MMRLSLLLLRKASEISAVGRKVLGRAGPLAERRARTLERAVVRLLERAPEPEVGGASFGAVGAWEGLAGGMEGRREEGWAYHFWGAVGVSWVEVVSGQWVGSRLGVLRWCHGLVSGCDRSNVECCWRLRSWLWIGTF